MRSTRSKGGVEAMSTDNSSQPEIPLTNGSEPDRMPLLRIQDLHTQFETKQGTVRAVDGLSLDLYEGEVLGLVGESGCGKTMTALSIMGLLPGNGRAVAGAINFEGKNLLQCSGEEMKKIRGRQDRDGIPGADDCADADDDDWPPDQRGDGDPSCPES